MKKIKLGFKSLLLSTFTLFSKFGFSIIGQMLLSEFLAIIIFPLLNFKQIYNLKKGLLSITVLFSLLLLFQVTSDIINHSSYYDFLRGWAAIVFSFIAFVFFVNFLNLESHGLLIYLSTLFLVNLVFGRGDFDISILESDSNYFKVRFANVLNPLILIFGYFLFKKFHYTVSVFFFFVISVFYFYMDARSNGIFYFFTSLILIFKYVRFDKYMRLITILLITIIVSSLYVLYVNLVLNFGFGGKNAYSQLNLSPNPYNPIWLFVYGRTEVVVLLKAISDSPIWGHGSWGKDSMGIYAELSAQITGSKSILYHPYINAHSIILGYWAFAGFGGLISIFLIYIKIFKMYLKVYQSQLYILFFPITTYYFVEFNWIMFFSPIGDMRVSFPFIAALLLLSYNFCLKYEYKE